MEIKTTTQTESGPIESTYRDISNNEEVKENITAVHAYCFYKGKLVICHTPSKGEKYWTIPGGGVEKGENIEEATEREIKEESNMKVLHREPLGCTTFTNTQNNKGVEAHVRSFCIVEPYGDFAGDPDGDITEIKLIDPADLPKYMDWGEIGDHMLKKAVEISKEYYSKQVAKL